MFIHVVVNGRLSFFVKAKLYSIVCIHCIFFIYSSVRGHLGCFLILAIVINTAMNMTVQIPIRYPDFNSESFPYDISHLVIENVRPEMALKYII